ncbi:MAG: hypothetical protein ACLR60_11950 [Clostridium paraputrificum]
MEENTGVNNNGRILFGVIGAFLGSLVGVILWILLYNFGYIASISGLVMVICAIKGYEKFGGEINKVGMVIILIMTIIMVYIATHLSYGVEIYSTFKIDGVTIFDGVKSVGMFLDEIPEVKSSFIKDLLMGYLFTLVGTFRTFKNLFL